VVSSLFPEDVQRRIMAEAEEQEKKEQRMTVSNKMKEFLQDSNQPKSKSAKAAELRGKPIADFFPEATVMFADLVGFTAWSSMREPTQVFTLLESIYNAFDEIARRRRVFKVETVGDCYVAVSGLPDPCVDHALVMARFASDCRIRMNDLVKELEVTLGPDTTELAMRFGLHSGPVTAGVLRGDKARFQLFGDTINTTSRIETTGKRDRIHISQETAEYLITAGKIHWLKLREDKVTAKGKQYGNTLFRPIKGFFSIFISFFSGKGELTTYWLAINKLRNGGKSLSSSSSHASDRSMSGSYHDINKSQMNLMSPRPEPKEKLSEKQRRLVNWITNELGEILRHLEVSRIGRPEPKSLVDLELLSVSRKHGQNPLDEVEEIITLPKYSAASHEFADEQERENFMLPKYVIEELRSYVSLLGGMYLENPFHNFEHARYVHLLFRFSIVVVFEIS
jgi:class 3 adenylate cyclase